MPQLSVIFHLYKMPYVTLNELSECMMLTKSTVSGIIDRLEKQGIVIREIPEDNRRIVRLSLSNDFKEKHDISSMKKEFISDCILDIIKDMGPVETDNFISSLEHFNSLLLVFHLYLSLSCLSISLLAAFSISTFLLS